MQRETMQSSFLDRDRLYDILTMSTTTEDKKLTQEPTKYCPICCLIRSGALGGMTGTAAGGSMMALISGYRVLNKSMTTSKGMQSILIAAIGTGIGFAATFTGCAFGSHRWQSLDVNSFNIIGATAAASGAMATSVYCGYLWSDLINEQTPRHSTIIRRGVIAMSGAFVVGGVAVKSLYRYLVLKRKVGLICIPGLLEGDNVK